MRPSDKQLLADETQVVKYCRLRVVGLLALAILLGCQKREEITRYTVEKPPPIEPLARLQARQQGGTAPAETPAPTGEPTDRTLGAIVPLAPQAWFFKLTGPAEAVAAQEEAFVTYLKSVRFSAAGKPTWSLPDGWQERPGNQIRFATLILPGEGKPLEVSVTALPNAGGDEENYLLQNVNRWRGQLRLPRIDSQQLADEATRIDLDGATATLVNLLGHAAADSMGRPPFFPGAPDGN